MKDFVSGFLVNTTWHEWRRLPKVMEYS